MKIEILHLPDCAHYQQALAQVQDVLVETRVPAEIVLVCVANDAEAQQLNFTGSPTVRVDGMDVEYADPYLNQAVRQIGWQCRLYREDGRIQGYPFRRMVQDSIEMAYLAETGQLGMCC